VYQKRRWIFQNNIDKFVSKKVDLIVTVATHNTQTATSAFEGTNIPVVFSAITDPVRNLTVSNPVDAFEKASGEQFTDDSVLRSSVDLATKQ